MAFMGVMQGTIAQAASMGDLNFVRTLEHTSQ